MGNELILNNDQTIVYNAIPRLDVSVEPKKLRSESPIALAVVFSGIGATVLYCGRTCNVLNSN